MAMPSSSKKQADFMNAVAHNSTFANKVGVPQSVGKDFSKADKALKLRSSVRTRPDRQGINKPKTDHGNAALFKEGGIMKHEDAKMDKGMMQKAVNKHEGRLHKGEPMTKLAKGGSASARADGCATKGKTKGMMVTMAGGGKTC
jgi:hypothetical protein